MGFARPLLILVVGTAFASSARNDAASAAAAERRARPEAHRATWDFADGAQGWAGGFADHPAGEEEFYELLFEHGPLPAELGAGRSGLHLSGNNHSDDLFMFVKRAVDGLEPNATYAVRLNLRIGSNASKRAVGIGGAPGTGVTFKAGATGTEPIAVDQDSFVVMNIDKGNQSTGGADAAAVGDIGVSTPASAETYRSKRLRLRASRRFRATTDGTGRLWLLLGTDSGFEGTTSIYVTRVAVALRRVGV